MADGERIGVLVVEDEPIILRHVARLVDALGAPFALVAAADGAKAALAALGEGETDILLTDIEMAGMNGLELIRQAKARFPQLRTVILSGYSSFDYAQTALRYGADDYLLKPVEPGQLRQVFDRLAQSIRSDAPDREPDTGAAALPHKIASFIQASFDKPLTVDQLAAHFNYAPSYIIRVFKKAYDVSPIQYQIALRMAHAKALLAQAPPATINQVAAATGYDDPRYFSRLFRQSEGMTPTQWQRRAQRGGQN